MTGIQCIHCNYAGLLDNQGIFIKDKTGEISISHGFKHIGHNPFSGNLHYKCLRCETIIIVDPMDVLGAVEGEIITDVREKPRRESIFAKLLSVRSVNKKENPEFSW